MHYYLDKDFGFTEFVAQIWTQNNKKLHKVKYNLFNPNKLCNEHNIYKFLEQLGEKENDDIKSLHNIQKYALAKAFKERLGMVLQYIEKQVLSCDKEIIKLLNKIGGS